MVSKHIKSINHTVSNVLLSKSKSAPQSMQTSAALAAQHDGRLREALRALERCLTHLDTVEIDGSVLTKSAIVATLNECKGWQEGALQTHREHVVRLLRKW